MADLPGRVAEVIGMKTLEAEEESVGGEGAEHKEEGLIAMCDWRRSWIRVRRASQGRARGSGTDLRRQAQSRLKKEGRKARLPFQV